MLRPDVLLTGEAAVSTRREAGSDDLLATQLARLDRKIDSVAAERRRLADLYQASFIEREELLRRGKELELRRSALNAQREALIDQREQLAQQNRLRDRVERFAHKVRATIDRLDFAQRQKLLRLVVDDVRVTGWRVEIRFRIPLDSPPEPPNTRVSSKDRLRSLHAYRGRQLPSAPTRRPRSGSPAPEGHRQSGRRCAASARTATQNPRGQTFVAALCSTRRRRGRIVGTPFVPTGFNGRGAQERSRDETACGARVSARPLTAPSTVAVPQPDSERSSNEVGNFRPAHLGKFQPALTSRSSCYSFPWRDLRRRANASCESLIQSEITPPLFHHFRYGTRPQAWRHSRRLRRAPRLPARGAVRRRLRDPHAWRPAQRGRDSPRAGRAH